MERRGRRGGECDGEGGADVGGLTAGPRLPRALKRRVVVGVMGLVVGGGNEELCRWDWLGRLRYMGCAYWLKGSAGEEEAFHGLRGRGVRCTRGYHPAPRRGEDGWAGRCCVGAEVGELVVVAANVDCENGRGLVH